ncbi:hypothetical protein F5Y15DRAFT_421744 [Xylariaceae sp. FL0016]|nr:hypothetical protein F5Y15DRAFT_421744 [Xylariaceae sp. FL0016]
MGKTFSVGIAWTILTTVLFVFPPEVPVTSENMNYCIAAFGVILLIAGTTWIFDGRKHYTGPHIDVQGLIHGKVEGMEGLDQVPAKGSDDSTSKVPAL